MRLLSNNLPNNQVLSLRINQDAQVSVMDPKLESKLQLKGEIGVVITHQKDRKREMTTKKE